MAMTINTNVSFPQRPAQHRRQQRQPEHHHAALSSGLRVNSAKDDASRSAVADHA